MRRILIATEGASCSIEAMRQFAEAFAPDDLTVFLVAVIPPVCTPFDVLNGSTLYRWEADEALIALDGATAALSRAGFTAFSLIRIGESAPTILRAAQDLDADLIVLAGQRRLRGRVAAEVSRLADCDVMVSPGGGEPSHGQSDHPAA